MMKKQENLTDKIVLAGAKIKSPTPDDINALKRQFLRLEKGHKQIPTASELLKSYHKLVSDNKLKANPGLERSLTKRAIRTLSGVSIITTLTKPFSCPGQCIYCPNDPQMPKSYIADEPAAARALALKFDPYEQVARRFEALEKNGHPTDKVELIVKGGTWNAYPINYQYWFILRCFQACNGAGRNLKINSNTKLEKLQELLLQAQKEDVKAKHRIIGLTLETRPDFITEKTVQIMRELGCTRLELGVQTTDDKILQLIKRGHDVEKTKRAVALLRRYGYKIDFHLMPQLPGSTPQKDLEMLLAIFSDSDYRPDMLKIYPCTVIENSELYEMLKAGQYKPYSDKQLIKVLKEFKKQVPRYVRISRLIRDIPSHHVKAGNLTTNLRQILQAEMTAEGTECQCLRCREVGHQVNTEKLARLKNKLFIEKYTASGGQEYFLSIEDLGRTTVFAFCRLRVDPTGIYPAYIRELHTYGQMLSIGKKNSRDSQHKGMGKKLVQEAEKIARKNRCDKLAVISGVGVRNYYRKLGFELDGTYMVKRLKKYGK